MQTNPAVKQNKNIKWYESPWNQPGRKWKGLWRKGFAEEPSLKFRMKDWTSKQWRIDGGYIGIYNLKSVHLKFLWGIFLFSIRQSINRLQLLEASWTWGWNLLAVEDPATWYCNGNQSSNQSQLARKDSLRWWQGQSSCVTIGSAYSSSVMERLVYYPLANYPYYTVSHKHPRCF